MSNFIHIVTGVDYDKYDNSSFISELNCSVKFLPLPPIPKTNFVEFIQSPIKLNQWPPDKRIIPEISSICGGVPSVLSILRDEFFDRVCTF